MSNLFRKYTELSFEQKMIVKTILSLCCSAILSSGKLIIGLFIDYNLCIIAVYTFVILLAKLVCIIGLIKRKRDFKRYNLIAAIFLFLSSIFYNGYMCKFILSGHTVKEYSIVYVCLFALISFSEFGFAIAGILQVKDKGLLFRDIKIINLCIALIAILTTQTTILDYNSANIADILNAERIASPGKYAYEKLGHKGRPNEMRIWGEVSIRHMLNNIMYIGHLPMLQGTTVSYKNHHRQAKDKSEWAITYNNHEPIISQELWDKVQERQRHMAQGRKTKTGYVHPLSGFLVCADCGSKMKMCAHFSKAKNEYSFYFNCGNHLRYGKTLCFSHYIPAKVLEEIVLDNIKEMAQRIVLDEDAIREEFLRHNAELAETAIKTAKKELQAKRKRTEELSRLMQIAYEDRLKGKMPEDICLGFIQKYSEEQKRLEGEIEELESKLTETENTMQSADEFIRNIKKYLEAPKLTREMCYELIDRIVIGGLPKVTGKEREIDIVYKVDIASVLRYKFRK